MSTCGNYTLGEDCPCRASVAEKRTMCRAMSHWQALRRAQARPEELVPLDDRELSPHVYLLSLAPRLDESRFVYCGAVLAELVGRDPTGQTVKSALPTHMAEQMVEFLKGAVQYQQPLADAGSQLGGDGSEILYRNVMMPMIGPGGRVDQVFGAFSYRSVDCLL